jgi:hypothetical protein
VNIPKWIYYVVGGVGFLMLYAITEFGWLFLASPLMFLAGLSLISYGTVDWINRKAATRLDEAADDAVWRKRVFMRIAATAQNISFVLLGLLLAFGAFVRLLKIWEPIWAYLQANPGWLLFAVGVGILLVSIQGLFGDQPGKTFLALLPRRISSVLGLVVALGLILMGFTALVWRPGFEAFVQMLLELAPDYKLLLTPIPG